MKTRQQRLNEVYEHLRHKGNVHTQEDFATLIGAKRPGISAAINGNELYLTDNLFKKICYAFPDTFNLRYLLTGEGQLLTVKEEVSIEDSEHVARALEFYDKHHGDRTEHERNIIDTATSLIVELEAMRRQTKDELMLLAQARLSMESATAELQKLIKSQRGDYFPGLAAEDTENK